MKNHFAKYFNDVSNLVYYLSGFIKKWKMELAPEPRDKVDFFKEIIKKKNENI